MPFAALRVAKGGEGGWVYSTCLSMCASERLSKMWDAPKSAIAVTVTAGGECAAWSNMAPGSSVASDVALGFCCWVVTGTNTGTVGASLGPFLAWPYGHPSSSASDVRGVASMAA